ncbi:MAG: hypothetical protein SFX73_37235 [Kofleriaceae bacterium]|nr:hypothetical protein [Kofleriaceae bacterium]
MLRAASIVICLAAVACGRRGGTPTPVRDDAAVVVPQEVAVELAERPLGLASVAEFGWRQRAGQPAFRSAREAEGRGEWTVVVTRCREALAADAGHLEAAWLLAAALGHLGKHEEVVAPLALAVAGDFGKWGMASLELPALAAFRATSTGEAWRRRVETDRTTYLAALARSTVVNAGGDLFAFDPQLARWHRLTRTNGLVLGGLVAPSMREIAYVARGQGANRKELGVGVVELVRGHTIRPLPIGGAGPITVAYGTKPEGFWIGSGKPIAWRVLADARLRPGPAKAKRPRGAWLEVKGTSTQRNALPVPTVTADWDEHGLASAIRIGSSNRVVSVPSPGLIDGNSAVWSPGKAQLAFVAQLDDTCVPGAIASAAYVADAATGKLTELERAVAGLALEWVTDRKLAIAGDRGVTIVDLDGGAPVSLAGATNLITPRRRPRCTEVEAPAPTEPAIPEPIEQAPDTDDQSMDGPP